MLRQRNFQLHQFNHNFKTFYNKRMLDHNQFLMQDLLHILNQTKYQTIKLVVNQ